MEITKRADFSALLFFIDLFRSFERVLVKTADGADPIGGFQLCHFHRIEDLIELFRRDHTFFQKKVSNTSILA